MLDIPPIILYSIIFLIISLAAKQIGKFFSYYGLPYITGYLLTGALAGPFVLELLPKDASETLRYIDDISLAVIAFIAGSELYLKEIKNRLRGIMLNTTGIVISAAILISITLFILQEFIPFTAGYNSITKTAVAMLGATILLALSPASTIAIIQEVRARGEFSKTVLSITVVMDVVIIILFALTVAFSSAMIDGTTITIHFLIILIIDLIIALISGYVIGQGIRVLFSIPVNNLVKSAALLLLGYLIFESSYYVPLWIYEVIGEKIKVEPLLMSMVAGFTVTNFTPYRKPFEDILHGISPAIYVAFFTLTGIGLKLDILVDTINIAAILFLVRIVAIVIGTYAGGFVAGEPQKFRKFAGLGLITQAGIALGLARETAVIFPDTLGGEFATLIISVVVLNEIFGPLLLKFALQQVGEAYVPQGKDGTPSRLLILGIEPQSITLARQMSQNGWEVIVADTDAQRVELLAAEDVDERVIPDISQETLQTLLRGEKDALVAMLDDDEANMIACEIAKNEFGISSMVVRLRDVSLHNVFTQLGARVIDPASAMVHLLKQSIIVPDAVSLLLHQVPDYTFQQVTVTEEAIHGMKLRDLRLPSDVLVLEINRAGQVIVPHGFSILRKSDKVTLMGNPDSLATVTLKLGY